MAVQALEVQVDHPVADLQPRDRQPIQPGGQGGVVDLDQPLGGVDAQAQHRLHHQEDRPRRPGLGQAGDRVGDRRLARLAHEAAEQFGQPHLKMSGRAVDLAQQHGDRSPLAVTGHPRRRQGRVVRPDRAVMIAHRIEAGLSLGQGPQAPARTELGRQHPPRHLSRPFVRRQAGEQQVPGVGGDGAALLPVAVQGDGVEALVLHPVAVLDQGA